MERFPKIAQLRTPSGLRQRLEALGVSFPVDEVVLSATEGSPLAAPIRAGGLEIGNRWCIHPMEGWDANRDGSPTDLTLRRWERFGKSGAKLIWGGEAAAVRPDGRANPNQTMAVQSNLRGLVALRERLEQGHRESLSTTDGLVVGLQLTHSGRYCRPNEKKTPEPMIPWHHPLLDPRVGIAADDDRQVFTDGQLEELIGDFVAAARVAREAGFQFVDVKACHGYLLHEFLGARHRPGPYGGDLEGRARLMLTIIKEVRSACPELEIGVRLSLYDTVPFQHVDQGSGPVPYDHLLPYMYGFGCNPEQPTELDLAEPLELVGMLVKAGVTMLNVTSGSPYYTPHYQRPAAFPPTDGYPPPEDPLVGVARHIDATSRVKAAFPNLVVVGSGYTYLQDFLPHVGQAVVRQEMTDLVGLGRMVLSYPEMPVDVLAGRALARKLVCRTFSDCTSAPRNGMVSGCYPLDAFYKERPERAQLLQLKGPDEA